MSEFGYSAGVVRLNAVILLALVSACAASGGEPDHTRADGQDSTGDDAERAIVESNTCRPKSACRGDCSASATSSGTGLAVSAAEQRILRFRASIGMGLESFVPELELEHPELLAYCAIPWASIGLSPRETDREGDPTNRVRLEIYGFARMLDAIEIDTLCSVKQFGSRESRLRRQLDSLRESRRDGTHYFPATYAGRATAEWDGLSDPSRDDRVAWYWWPSALGSVPLSLLETNRDQVGIFTSDQRIVQYRESLIVDILDESDFGVSGERSFADLCWWRIGEYVGVSSGRQPGLVLWITDGSVFRYETIEVAVHSSPASEPIAVRIRTYVLDR